jgi:hypothetical protein
LVNSDAQSTINTLTAFSSKPIKLAVFHAPPVYTGAFGDPNDETVASFYFTLDGDSVDNVGDQTFKVRDTGEILRKVGKRNVNVMRVVTDLRDPRGVRHSFAALCSLVFIGMLAQIVEMAVLVRWAKAE